MSSAERRTVANTGQGNWFTTTHWSVVLAAGGTDAPAAFTALDRLCRTYWYPLYAYVRRQGKSSEDAQDLTQAFFERLLARNYLAGLRPEKGKFRAFLLASLKHFLADDWDKSRAQKRGGGRMTISLDDTTIEERYRLEPADNMDPERLFERRWALTVLEQARERLKQEHIRDGTGEQFERLKVFDSGDRNAPPYAEVASQLGLTESAVKSAIFRLRRRFREIVRDEVAGTVESPAEIDEEIRHLISVLSA